MSRPVSLLPALVAATLAALAGLVLLPVPTASAAAGRAEDAEPLQVTIDSLTPSELPERGPIQVSGTVTNLDDQPWTEVYLYPFVSDAPMTTTAELDAAAATDPLLPVGERIIDPGPFFTVDELAPGQSASYTFTVSRKRLGMSSSGVLADAAGVYWFGVHALGEGPDGRVDGADGRARTFLPLVPPPDAGRRQQAPEQQTVDAALVIPIRHAVGHRADGRVASARSWARTLGVGGQLRRLVDLGAAAGSRPVTWLVDPAVTDAAARIAAGNPPRSLAPTVDLEAGGSASPSPSDGADADTEGDEDSADAVPETGPRAEGAEAATDWLARTQTALEGDEILSLPYGDLDVAAAASHAPAAYRAARSRSGDQLAPWGLRTSPAVAEPGGYVSPASLRLVDADTTVLVSDRALGERATTAPVAEVGDHTLVVASSGAAAGGPGPEDPLSPVAVRQRIVSEAALRLLAPGDHPLVTVLPADWSPDSSAGFFEGLDLDWLHLTTVDAISHGEGRELSSDRLVYPEAQRNAELDGLDFAAAEELTAAGATLQNLLTLNDRVGGVVRDEAMTDVSYASRRQPVLSRVSASRSQAWIEQRLGSVTVEGPKAVILSSGSGRFSVTVTNSLDEPVSVRLDAVTDPKLEVSVPRRTIEIGPGSRSSILLNAASRANGVRNARLVLTDSDGTPIGSSDLLPIRSNQVSDVIWLILGTGVALLFATIVVRLVRRIRSAARSSTT